MQKDARIYGYKFEDVHFSHTHTHTEKHSRTMQFQKPSDKRTQLTALCEGDLVSTTPASVKR